MLHVLCACVKYRICVGVCPTPSSLHSLATTLLQPAMPSWPLRSLCYWESCEVYNRTYFISWCHTCCVAWPPSPILSLFSWDHWEAYPSLPPSLYSFHPTFFFSFFSSFFVKRVWTHQIFVNMLPYARLKPRPRSHRRNWRGGKEKKRKKNREKGEEKGEMRGKFLILKYLYWGI